MTIELKNEEPICRAVMCLIEGRDGGPMTVTDRPDRTDRRRPAVELLFESPSKRYAIEHTRIESFPSQIADGKAFSDLLEPLETALSGRLPGCFMLVVAVGATDGIRASDHWRIRGLVERWILSRASSLEGQGPSSTVTEQPPGVPFPLILHRTPTRRGSRLRIFRGRPEELEPQRAGRVQQAVARKCPKLAVQKVDGRETILVLESDDIALANCADICASVSLALAGRDDVPDSVFLVDTAGGRPWYLWALKEGADLYPCQRLRDPVEVA